MERINFERMVECLSQARDNTGAQLKMKSIMLTKGDETFRHDFSPHQGLTDLRSISKVPLAMAVGVAIARGAQAWGAPLSLETKIFPLLEPYTVNLGDEQLGRLRRVELRHLLSNTIGHDQGFLFRKDIGGRDMGRLLEYIASIPVTHEPGTHFSYSNVGPYLVSVLVQQQLGVSLSDWVRELVFSPLKITNFQWVMYGPYVAGCSGLSLSNEDLHKLGYVLLHDGKFAGNQVVPAEWISKMRSPIVRSPQKYEPHRAFPKFAYGLSLWITENGNYYCDGTDGQYLIVIPTKRTIITTTGHQSDMKPITECMRGFL